MGGTEEEEEGVGISHTSNMNMIHEGPTAAGTGRGSAWHHSVLCCH